MSMQNIPFSTYGIYIPQKNEDSFLEKYNKIHNTEFESFNEMYQDFLEINGSSVVYADIDEDASMQIFINENNTEILDSRELDGSLIISLYYQPSLFGRSYSTLSDTVEEMKTALADYLPEDFPYDKHIGYFDCVYFG